MTRQKLNSFRSNQIEVSYLVLVSKSKEMCRKFPEIRSLSYFKRINGLEFWCLQIPLKVVTFWDEPKLAKSCPANFVPLKKFRVQNNEHVTPSRSQVVTGTLAGAESVNWLLSVLRRHHKKPNVTINLDWIIELLCETFNGLHNRIFYIFGNLTSHTQT